MPKVLIPQDITEAGKAKLRDKGYEFVIGSGHDEETLKREIADCDAVIARTAQYPRQVLEAGKQLKIIARYGIGVDNIDLEAANELGIWVTNAPRSSSNAVAEHTILLMLGAARNLQAVSSQYRKAGGCYSVRGRYQATELPGKVLGLVGSGRIGSAVAQKAALGFDMQVLVYDPYIQTPPPNTRLVDSLNELLAESDFVSLHLPLTDETRGLVDSAFLHRMKPTACLLNLARGEIVNETDLITALKDGTIACAGLDVLEQEPPLPNNPLLTMDNVVLTPHNASMTREAMDIMGVDAAACIDQVMRGEAPAWPVNRPKAR